MSLGALDRSLRTILSRRVSVALGLWGEAGQGKTHAARYILSALPCASLSLPASLSGAQLVAALPPPNAPTALTAAALARLSRGERLPQDALIQTLAALLAASAPFVLHLEDLHDLSPERLSFTEYLAQVIKRTRGVGLLVTSRQLPPAPFVSRLLPPMNEAESAELLSREVGLEVGAALPVFYAVSLLRLANEALCEGAFEEAERLLGEAHTLMERHSDLAFLTESHLKHARLYLDWQPVHGPPLALRHAQAALELSRQTADHKQLPHALIYAARAAAQNRLAVPALAYAQEACDHAEQGHERQNVADAQFALGLALEAGGQLEAACRQLSLACQTWEDLGQTSTAQHRRLELDRLAGDRQAAYQRRDELRAAGSLGAAHLAERYFPPLAERPLPAQASAQVVRLQVLGPLKTETRRSAAGVPQPQAWGTAGLFARNPPGRT